MCLERRWLILGPLKTESLVRSLGDITWAEMVLLLAAGISGGFFRGYSGFGFALSAVPILNMGVAPAVAVPSVLTLECSIGLLTTPGEKAHIEWGVLRNLTVGTLLGTPIGILILYSAPAEVTRLLVTAATLLAVAVMWRRPKIAFFESGRTLAMAGLLSGLLNGGTAMSGPPAVLALMAGSLSTRRARATLMGFILFSAALGIGISTLYGLQTVATLRNAAIMAPAVLIGTLAGSRLFHYLPEHSYRVASLAALAAISVVTLVATIVELAY